MKPGAIDCRTRGPVVGAIVLAAAALFGLLLAGCSPSSSNPSPKLTAARLLIEHNATDEDTGFQGFADGEPWNDLTLSNPDGADIAVVTAGGGLLDFGLTELFFETAEPENAEVAIADVLALLPEGRYRFDSDPVEGGNGLRNATFTHVIPAGPALTSPEDGATGLAPDGIVVAWEAVSEDLDGNPVDIVGYQVIVEEDAEPANANGFARAELSLHLPADATSVTLPDEFVQNDRCYGYEVLAIEASGNQSLSSAAFETGAGCVPPGSQPETGLKEVKLLIEHNATDEDTGFQGFADGEPWDELTISGPGDVEILRVTPQDGLSGFGLTELFFETSEPENAEVPIADVLGHLPEGTYTFRARSVEDVESVLTATLTHDIPAGPVLTGPANGADDVDAANTVVSWEPVTQDLDGNPIDIVGYQVIVERADEEDFFPDTFAQPVFSVYLPASATSVTVPAAFMEDGTEYVYEVLAIEASGNQTLSSAEFETQ